MSRTKKNEKLVEEIFTINKDSGVSNYIKIREINLTGLKLGNNGNIRQDTPWTDKYKWLVDRKNNKSNGTPIGFQTIGYSNSKLKDHPISSAIRIDLLKQYPHCTHCGNNKTLCIDHKDDTYRDERVLNIDTQVKDDFQVLCNKCNKDLKHQINVKEKKTGKLHKVKELNINPFIYDQFDYPWEVGLTEYNERNLHCKMYTYWYDIKVFHHKRDWFVILRGVNRAIKRYVKLIP